jgi:hypothetical protein
MDRMFFASDYDALAAIYQARATAFATNPPDPGPLGLPAGANIARSAVAWATDSNFSAAYAGDKAIDGIVSTASKWTSNGNPPPHWIALDLGAVKGVTGFVVRSAADAGEFVDFGFKTFDLQTGSLLSGPWTTIAGASNPNQLAVFKVFNPAPVNTRFVRLNVTHAGIDNYARLPEFEVYGAGASVGEWSLY